MRKMATIRETETHQTVLGLEKGSEGGKTDGVLVLSSAVIRSTNLAV